MTRDTANAPIELRDVADLAGCREAVEIEKTIWGDNFDVVPASLLLVSVKRGGILIGAFERDVMQGFVWSMPGWRDGEPTHWSHMLGVLDAARGHGLGLALKRAQAARAAREGIHLIEWTFDPLQARNANLNMTRLGCRASTYLVNVYGALDGPLHRGTPTDRLIAEWRLSEHGASDAPGAAHGADSPAPSMIACRAGTRWPEVTQVADAPADGCVTVPVPPDFSEMQREATTQAMDWRLATREAFQRAFAAGFQVVGFEYQPDGGGRYLLRA